MKWLKTIIGIVLIVASVFAIYIWNSYGREKMTELKEAENPPEVIVEVDPRKEMTEKGLSYFAIENAYIKEKSSLLEVGDTLGIYSLSTKEKLGSFELALVNEDGIEIICSIDDYFVLAEHPIYDLVVSLEAVE